MDLARRFESVKIAFALIGFVKVIFGHRCANAIGGEWNKWLSSEFAVNFWVKISKRIQVSWKIWRKKPKKIKRNESQSSRPFSRRVSAVVFSLKSEAISIAGASSHLCVCCVVCCAVWKCIHLISKLCGIFRWNVNNFPSNSICHTPKITASNIDISDRAVTTNNENGFLIGFVKLRYRHRRFLVISLQFHLCGRSHWTGLVVDNSAKISRFHQSRKLFQLFSPTMINVLNGLFSWVISFGRDEPPSLMPISQRRRPKSNKNEIPLPNSSARYVR